MLVTSRMPCLIASVEIPHVSLPVLGPDPTFPGVFYGGSRHRVHVVSYALDSFDHIVCVVIVEHCRVVQFSQFWVS